ncbi:TIGR02444 family protein [Pseudomonas saxonica]|uniref:TIGR02444 family protein n=1 Tax=Pseudomonas saxonica TaxID=2600598 RepID=A0A5C5PWR3_9PSED|nr:TIGR02444 family protein [Pseudomonas saxonica]TWR91297.1 TIGR02444 family protein [Pseudomonas saxonica]TWR94191.1 TIGR02444 family protein [Pseudomonas saxonica]WRQ76827.1 TIGR02444 family protein [Pseudomonas saxonica]
MQNDLWNYCLNLYARPGVEHACLRLQDQGMDVCLLLCAAWLQQRGIACTEARMEQLKDCAEPWQREVVQPLRQLRTQWREACAQDEALAALRVQVKALELEAERTLLSRLEALSQQWQRAQSQDNCDWPAMMAASIDRPDYGALQTLRAAIDPA